MEFIPGGVDELGDIVAPDCEPFLLSAGLIKRSLLMISVTSITNSFRLGEVLQINGADLGFLYSIDLESSAGQMWIVSVDNPPVVTAADTVTGNDATAVVDSTEVVNGIIYTPISNKEEHKSVTIVDNLDGTKKIATYCRGNIKVDLKVKDILKFSFEYQGVYDNPTAEALIDADFSENEPVICSNALIGIGDVNPELFAVESFEFDFGNNVVQINDIQANDAIRAIFITDRNPTGSINPTTLSLSDWNPFDIWQQHNRQKIFITVGQEAGKRCRIEIPQAQFDIPDDTGDRDGIQVTNIPFQATGRTTEWQDNEFAIMLY
jgi:hypothetical protein